MRFFNVTSSPSTAATSSNFKQKAIVGSTFGLCMGVAALGTANFFGYNGRTVSRYMVSSAVSLATLLGMCFMMIFDKMKYWMKLIYFL
ncbi:hypothetical protein BCR42DRAFT_117995 [Absidia repens]|uniref:Uncharacterized protein n=1 Tax=Absidia repens TaxID=90262 RepID=A0A1X2I7B9_9FUNG|nr:hypothetical protein BCR42DRAFT_117995 [Absidia repens]